jgi:signal transduction histidine kinase
VATVRDDGCGFDPAAETHGVPGHFGLADMRERAELSAGTLVVESSPGHGTVVDFWIPITAAMD